MIISKQYTNKEQQDDYLKLVKDKYGKEYTFSSFFRNLQVALDYTLQSEFQEAFFVKQYSNNTLIGHIALIIDTRLPKNRAIVGFFECNLQKTLFSELWTELLSIARDKGVEQLVGPINATTWHLYRVASDNLLPDINYPSQLLTEDYYYNFFKMQNPIEEVGYYSGVRQEFDGLIKLLKPAYEASLAQGFQVFKSKEFTQESLKSYFEISTLAFKDNWSYVKFTEEEFFQLYSTNDLDNNTVVYEIKINQKVLGFCSVLINNQQWVMKTMAVLPKYQEMGLGNALVYKVHADAKKANVKSIIYALIRDTNKVRYFPKDDARVIRQYSAFTFKI